MEQIKTFCNDVLSGIPRATPRERADIRDELLDHLLEHKDVLMGYGLEEAEAEKRAVEAMGDAEGIGKAWNEKLSPVWLWLGRVCMVCCVLLVWYALARSEYRLRMIWNIWQVQQKEVICGLDEMEAYDLVWDKDPGICEEFGEHMIRIHRTALWEAKGEKERYVLQVYMITYPQDPMVYPLSTHTLLGRIESNAERTSGSGAEFDMQGYSEARHNYFVEKGMEVVELDLEYHGHEFHAEIELDWGGAQA